MTYQTPFVEATKVSRSVLSLAKESPTSNDRILMSVNHAIKHSHSHFHVQSCRAIVLCCRAWEVVGPWNGGSEKRRSPSCLRVIREQDSRLSCSIWHSKLMCCRNCTPKSLWSTIWPQVLFFEGFPSSPGSSIPTSRIHVQVLELVCEYLNGMN